MSVELHSTGDHITAFVGYSTESAALFAVPEQKIGIAKPKKEDVKQTDHVHWGDSDDMPALLADMWKKNPDLIAALRLASNMLYAHGLTYRVENPDGKLINKRIPEVEQLIERSWMYPRDAVNHIFRYFIAFPQLLFDASREKVLKIHPLKAPHCRFEHVDANGFLYKLYLNGKWNEGAIKTSPETKSFKVLDPYYYDPYTFKSTWQKNDFSVVLPCSLPTEDTYYPTPDYWTLKLSKWFDLAQKIPVFKDTIMKNQISIKYLIEMPDWWMESTYPDWKDRKPAEQKELVKKELQKFEAFAAGFEKAGKSLTVMVKSKDNLKEYSQWNIKPIDDKMKDGMYVEDSLEATVKIYTSVGLDPGVIGITPGKPGGSRSGSERRESYNIWQALNYGVGETILRPYVYAAIMNGYTNDEQRVVFGFKTPQQQTLDKVTASGRETVVNDNEN